MTDTIEKKTIRLSKLEYTRDQKRKELEEKHLQKLTIERQLAALSSELETLDTQIDTLEADISKQQTQIKTEPGKVNHVKKPPPPPTTSATHEPSFGLPSATQFTQNPDEILPEPSQTQSTMTLQPRTGRIQDFFALKKPPPPSSMNASIGSGPVQPPPLPITTTSRHSPGTTIGSSVATTSTHAVASFSSGHTRSPPNRQSDHHTYPWTQEVFDLLHNTFKIPSFRETQLDVINATLSGQDAFVIMRTGGGKSLTYQLPSILEGRGPSRKITVVVSPLVSLIQDQEDQLNQFVPHSALSFTASLGVSEHARRWGLVRDPSAGVCPILVTPEKVSKSNKLCSELDKLHAKNRLGRIVIDESHCASTWGHDFRPDYATLGKLKSHFPTIPVLAVTATASDRVRKDVVQILRLNQYKYFRSTAHRPNLTYSVATKTSTVIEDMAAWIKEHAPNQPGIVYTYSRKDANTVAKALTECGIQAQAYHSDVSASKRASIHQSWMKNKTQVVTATIAFGLGINKPDVRFVLHHSISKTLEAYYQESGRAGRELLSETAKAPSASYSIPQRYVFRFLFGGLANKSQDVIRMLKMVHGSNDEKNLLPMVRYAQCSGNDAVCKAIILKHLGEPDCPDVRTVVRENEGTTTVSRDIGVHARTLVQLLDVRTQEGRDMTLNMLVKDWRSTSSSAPQCVRDNPPAKAGLSVEDCERIVLSLMLENVLAPNPIWNAYDTVIYFVLGQHGRRLALSTDPRITIRFPKKVPKSSTKASRQAKARKSTAKSGEWLSAKPRAKRRKTTAKAKPKKSAKDSKPKAKKTSKKKSEVIELLSDDGDESLEDDMVTHLKENHNANNEDGEGESSDEEFEFDE